MSIMNGDYHSRAVNAIFTILAGSWMVDALDDITDEQKELVTLHFIDTYGDEELLKTIEWFENDQKMALAPNFFKQRHGLLGKV